ncbi:MAG: hypothetical protein ACFFEF_17465 [Candidatus Thorarchaeota archaeon]
MGWGIRALLVGLTGLLILLLYLSIPPGLDPTLNMIGLLLLATFGVNLMIGIVALFKFGGEKR